MVYQSGAPRLGASMLDGSETVGVASASPLNTVTTLAGLNAPFLPSVYTNSQTASATLTILQMIGNNPINPAVLTPPNQAFMLCNGTLGGAATFTTPTGAAMIAALTHWLTLGSYEFDIINAGTGQTITLAAGATGVTITGTATIANNTWRKFLVTKASATAVTITSLEVGTYS